MGVSFKVSKRGSRFRPKPQLLQSNTNVVDEEFRNSKDSDRIPSRNESAHTRKLEGKVSEGGKGFQPLSGFSEGFPIAENEVSFTLNLFRDGYSIGKPSKNEAANQITPQDIPKLLLPYDRTSESLFSAIESDRLPGDVLDDIPCKFVDGTLLCEVWDYRNYTFDQGLGVPSTNGFPIVNKIQLKMSLENVVKDIPLVSDNTWTYGDLMEVESRILKALKPQLHLDPTPKLDRLCNNPASTKLNLSHCSLRRKWLKQLPEVSVTSNSKVHGRNICIDRVPESSNGRLANSAVMSGNMIPQQIPENMNDQDLGLNMLVRQKSSASDAQGLPLVSSQSRYSMGIGTPRNMPEPMPGPIFYSSGASPAGPDVMSCGENVDPSFSLLGKRENQDSQMSLGFNKRQRSTSAIDGAQQHQLATHMDNLHGSDVNWKNTLLQQQAMASGIQHTNTGIQKFSQQVFEGVLNQDTMTMPFNGGQPGVKYGAKEEQFKTEKLDGSEPSRSKSDMQMAESEMTLLEPQQSRLQQKLQHQAFMRSNFRQAARNNLGQHIENDTRKEEQIHKTKMTQSPRLSAGSLVQSPLSSKSGEFSSGSGGPQHYSAATNNAAVVASQKEKAAIAPAPAIGGNPSSLTSSANDSMQRQHQAAAKQRSNSLPKTPAMNGVGSPTSVSNMSVPMNANSPSVGTPPLADQTILERFSKIEMVMRHQLNRKKNKVEDCPTRKLNVFPAHNIMAHLANASNFDDIKDDTSSKKLSKSLIGGSLNTCKKRTVKALVQERIVQGNAVTCVPRCRTRMILSERLSDGTVAMAHGELEEADFVAAEEFLPTLPNTHLADLLADQFHALMEREGYDVEDHIQLKQNYPNPSTSSQLNPGAVPINSASEMHQFTEPVPGPQSNEIPKHGINQSLTPSQNHLPNTRMLPPGTNSQAIQMSQGIMSGVSMPQKTPEMDPQQPLLQQQPQQPQTQQQNQHSMIQQQQHPQFQRLMLASNPLSSMNFIGQNPNMQLGNHMVNKPSALQLQVLQQQQQQQQHQQQPIQRKLMMGLGTAVGMGNLGNNMMGLGGLGNATGLGAARGMGGPGISSSPMAPISGNVGQNPMNLSQASNITNAISQQLRSGALTPAQAQAALMSELRMQQQNRVSMLGGPQLNLAGLPRARQIHPGSASLSMLGQALNRANMSPLQRAPMGPTMGPPKLMAGMNLYMNQQHQHQQQQMQLQQQMQQQQQQQQQQHQQQQQQHQQQQQQQQQQPQQQQQQQQLQPETSSIQTVVSLSPPQVGSPSTMGISQPSQQIQQQQQQQQQQQMSPQQMGQRTPLSPQQMSSGAIHALSAGNQEACPASPQLSSQTVASIGNIAHSPMEIQGVNKSSYVNNG